MLIDDGSRSNVLNGNFIGTAASGDAPIANLGNGVWINRADNNQLIGCKFVNNPFVYYNVISGNRRNGLRITDANNSVVQGNFFGSGANNATTVANRLDGILVDGSSANTQVGGVIPLGNVSAGNGRNGIEVAGRARGFTTFNTFGGLHAFGGAAPNGNDGLLITSTGRRQPGPDQRDVGEPAQRHRAGGQRLRRDRRPRHRGPGHRRHRGCCPTAATAS